MYIKQQQSKKNSKYKNIICYTQGITNKQLLIMLQKYHIYMMIYKIKAYN